MPKTTTPVLLIKTRSKPSDLYEERFSSSAFVPCLSHQILESASSLLQQLILDGSFSNAPKSTSVRYGGIVFTSQRAVEAFGAAIQRFDRSDLALGKNVILYVVGPATSRALRALDLPCPIRGEDTGNGQALALYILDDYLVESESQRPGLLFLVGEQRRDIIPATLQDPALPRAKQIHVDELEVYRTVEHVDFGRNFSAAWQENGGADRAQWVVVFSPSGCKTILQVLGLLDNQTMARMRHKTRIVAIGPTTRDFMIKEFGFTPDAVAETPTPEGVSAAIEASE